MRTVAYITKGGGVNYDGDVKGRYRLASLSKQFTAAAVGVLVERGILDLEADISHYLPDFTAGICLKHLLNHSSGLPDYEPRVTTKVNDRAVRELISCHQHPLFTPGTTYAYSNGGYCLLAEIVASVTDFETFVASVLLEPLGILGASYRANQVGNRVYGFALSHGKVVESDQSFTTGTYGDGGLYMNMEEYLLWLRGMLGTGVWTVGHMAQGENQRINEDLSYAWGWFMSKEGHLMHTGSSSGFSHAVRFDPYEKVGFVYFSNLADDHHSAFEIERELFPRRPLLQEVLGLTN
jgi:CubicO group peptidase (beta-lactamase class C family)